MFSKTANPTACACFLKYLAWPTVDEKIYETEMSLPKSFRKSVRSVTFRQVSLFRFWCKFFGKKSLKKVFFHLQKSYRNQPRKKTPLEMVSWLRTLHKTFWKFEFPPTTQSTNFSVFSMQVRVLAATEIFAF